MSDMLVEKTQAVLGKVLDGAAARQRALADNLANVETPGYLRKDVRFESALHDAIQNSPADIDRTLANIEGISLDSTNDRQTPVNAQGNNVEIDHEMVEMAKNSLQYNTAAQLLTMEISQMKTAIHEGRR